jgi:hypothetical protein
VKLPRDDLYIPTNPDCRVLELLPESAAPMQVSLQGGCQGGLLRRLAALPGCRNLRGSS